MTENNGKCPVKHLTTLPGDGTPLAPSPKLAKWRSMASATPLSFDDGHEGLIATRYEAARLVLADPRFSMSPARLPLGPSADTERGELFLHAPVPAEIPGPLDEDAQISEKSSLLSLDGDEHSRLRRLVSPRFSLKQARGRREWVANMVAEQVKILQEKGSPADLWVDYALPIAARTHCKVIGIPDSMYEEFVRLFQEKSTAQAKYDFIREVIAIKKDNPGEDVISDFLASDELSSLEAQGLLRMLMVSGRDSVAYLIATTMVALLTNQKELDALLRNPDHIDTAVEEFMRVGAMFITLFPRTAVEDVELDGVLVKSGQSVSVSSVAANRDPERWENPDQFDVNRDAFGHLGFGYGIHGCIGQQLARIEISEAVSQLIQAFKGLTLVHAEQLEPMAFAHPVAVYEAGSVIAKWD